jgi:hypothetical protein
VFIYISSLSFFLHLISDRIFLSQAVNNYGRSPSECVSIAVTDFYLVEVKNAWRYTSTPPYVFRAWCLVKHRDNFTLPFTPIILILFSPVRAFDTTG